MGHPTMRLDLGVDTDFVSKGWGKRVKALGFGAHYTECRGSVEHRYVYLPADNTHAQRIASELIRLFPGERRRAGVQTSVMFSGSAIRDRWLYVREGQEATLGPEAERFVRDNAEARVQLDWVDSAWKLAWYEGRFERARAAVHAAAQACGRAWVVQCLDEPWTEGEGGSWSVLAHP